MFVCFGGSHGASNISKKLVGFRELWLDEIHYVSTIDVTDERKKGFRTHVKFSKKGGGKRWFKVLRFEDPWDEY